MKSIFKTSMVASAAALSLGLAACDAPREDALEEQAEVVDERADALEDDGAIGDAPAMDDTAVDEVRDERAEALEEQSDAMEEAADDMDADPQ